MLQRSPKTQLVCDLRQLYLKKNATPTAQRCHLVWQTFLRHQSLPFPRLKFGPNEVRNWVSTQTLMGAVAFDWPDVDTANVAAFVLFGFFTARGLRGEFVYFRELVWPEGLLSDSRRRLEAAIRWSGTESSDW